MSPANRCTPTTVAAYHWAFQECWGHSEELIIKVPRVTKQCLLETQTNFQNEAKLSLIVPQNLEASYILVQISASVYTGL